MPFEVLIQPLRTAARYSRPLPAITNSVVSPSHGEAKMELFDYIEVFYNQRRRHSTLGQISPAAFERRATHAA